MIIVRSPLRITLGGGGTDMPAYYREHEGFLVAAAIDKYVYVTIMRPFTQGIYLKYSSLEHVQHASEINHPIIRESLLLPHLSNSRIEITTLADIPTGTGLGSSGSFTTALLKGLYAYQHKLIPPKELAELACHIEIEKLQEPIGKQDQYIASHGGLSCMTFHKNDQVAVSPLNIASSTLFDLEDNLLLFFTGFSRSASNVLRDQYTRSKNNDPSMISNLNYIKELGYRSQAALETNNLQEFCNVMKEHWEYKKQRSQGMTNSSIDEWYNIALQNGAISGKVVGAGGGGFLMFYAENRTRLRQKMSECGLEEVRFRFDFEGTKVLLS